MPASQQLPEHVAPQRERAGGRLLAGATTLVAGGAGRVGRHIVGALLDAGATVIVPSRSADRAGELRKTTVPAHQDRLVTLVGDIGDERDGQRLLDEALAVAGPLHGAVASLGGFVAAPSILAAPRRDLVRALEGYLLAHFDVARTVIPALRERGGGYVFINGPLAFDARFPGTGLVSIATAGQAMLARVLAKELEDTRVRVNELVIYSSFGWGRDDQNAVSGADIGRYVAYLLSDRGAGVRGQTIHLKSPEQLAALGGQGDTATTTGGASR